MGWISCKHKYVKSAGFLSRDRSFIAVSGSQFEAMEEKRGDFLLCGVSQVIMERLSA